MVEDQVFRCRITAVDTKITIAQKLEFVASFSTFERRLYFAVRQNDLGLRIELIEEIALGLAFVFLKHEIMHAHLSVQGMGDFYPVQGAFDFSAGIGAAAFA